MLLCCVAVHWISRAIHGRWSLKGLEALNLLNNLTVLASLTYRGMIHKEFYLFCSVSSTTHDEEHIIGTKCAFPFFQYITFTSFVLFLNVFMIENIS